MASGIDIGLPNRLVAMDRRETSTRTLLRSLMRAKASRLPLSEASSSEPRSKNSNTPRGSRRRAASRRSAMFWHLSRIRGTLALAAPA